MKRAVTAELAAAGLMFAAGCQTIPAPEDPAAASAQPPAGTARSDMRPVGRPKITGVDVAGARGDASALKDPNSPLSKRSIYFDYDRFDVKEDYRPILEAHARYLRENPSARMLVQGNADERGSREYNVALGQKRSQSVMKVLILLGAQEAQLEAVSLGEEKPRCSERGEQCWAKNRRGDILYRGEF